MGSSHVAATKMFHLNDITNESAENHYKEWPLIPVHAFRMIIIGASGSGKTNALLKLVKE